MIRINLLPARISRRQMAGRRQFALIVVAILLALVVNIVWSQTRAGDLASRERKLRRTRESIAQLERIIGEVKAIEAQQAIVKDKLAVLEKLKAGRQGPVRVLDDLATLIPKRVWLRRFEERGGAVTFEGTAGTIDDVSAFLAALKRSQYFGAPELRKTTAKIEKAAKLVEFTITSSVNYTPAVQVATAAAAAPGGR